MQSTKGGQPPEGLPPRGFHRPRRSGLLCHLLYCPVHCHVQRHVTRSHRRCCLCRLRRRQRRERRRSASRRRGFVHGTAHRITHAKALRDERAHVLRCCDSLQKGQQPQQLGVSIIIIPADDGHPIVELEAKRLQILYTCCGLGRRVKRRAAGGACKPRGKRLALGGICLHGVSVISIKNRVGRIGRAERVCSNWAVPSSRQRRQRAWPGEAHYPRWHTSSLQTRLRPTPPLAHIPSAQHPRQHTRPTPAPPDPHPHPTPHLRRVVDDERVRQVAPQAAQVL